MKKNTILWADDDADDLMLMKEVLLANNQDFDIVEVPNGKQALHYLKKAYENSELPSLIILDINMPVLDGKETLAIIRNTKEYDSIPVVVFTTSNSELDKVFCKRYHVEMITKPPYYKSLETTIIRILNMCNTSEN
jgi:CheY-like chemotaxis protein